jgi:hypothetical protein
VNTADAVVVIEVVVAPVFHNSVPPVAVVDKVEEPLQLLTTITEGVEGVANGDAVPVPAELVHPLEVAVTL